MEILKVSSKSNPNSVAGAIAATIKEESRIYVQAIGAGASNCYSKRFCSSARL